MNRSTVASRWNLDLIEENYQCWRDNPASVGESWRAFFEGYELGSSSLAPPGTVTAGSEAGPTELDLDFARCQAGVTRMIVAYREIGNYLARLDPLNLQPRSQNHEQLSARGVRPYRSRPRQDLLQPLDRPSLRHPAAASVRAARDVLPHHRRRVHAHPRSSRSATG